MSHLNTKPGEHDHTASAFVVRLDGDEPRLMLHMHKKLNRYLQFGGHIETLETPWEAIKHELREESGYEMSQVTLLQPKLRIKTSPGAKLHPVPIYQITVPFDDMRTHFHTDLAYAVVTREEPRHPLSEDESDEMILLTREELIAMSDTKTPGSIHSAGLFIFDVCLNEWEEVNPATFD